MTKLKNVKIADLIVNTENYRFEPTYSQREAIDKMIEDQGDYLYNLAEHIVENGLNPNDKIQVLESTEENDKYIVLEGNRRAVAMKLLKTPTLIEDEKNNLRRKFKNLSDEKKLLDDVEVIVYDNPEEADIWIGIKHGYGKKGIGTDSWGPLQKQRFGEKTEGKTSTAVQVVKFLEESRFIAQEIKENINKIKTTNLDRMIKDPSVREFLGVDIYEGVLHLEVEEKEVAKGLSYLVKDILKPAFTVKKIYNKEARKKYIKNIPKESTPNKEKKIKAQPINEGTKLKKKEKPKPKPTSDPQERDVLIPTNYILAIKNPKVYSIYKSLKRLKLSDHSTVVAVSFRVFVENSMDIFIENKKINKTKDGRTLDKNSKLKTKIIGVAQYMEDNKLADKHICKGIKSAADNPNDLLGVETLNAYVHNSEFSPIPKNLVVSWDNIQKFIENVWQNID